MIDPNNSQAMPNAYDVANIMTGYQRDAQFAESEKLKLGEQKRLLSEAALARQIKTEAVKGLESSQAQAMPQAPVGLNPQAPEQPQAAPGSTAFWQGQNTAAPAQEPTPVTPVQQYKDSQSEFATVSNKIKEYSAISKALKDQGLVDQADQYDTKIIGLQGDQVKAKDKFLDHSIKVLGLSGQLMNGYLDFVKAHPDDPAAQNFAWQQMSMQAKMLGADDDNKLAMTPPDQRQMTAEQIADQSKTGKERAQIALEQERAKSKAAHDLTLSAIKREGYVLKDRLAANSRDFQEKKLAFNEHKFEYNAFHKNIEQQIKVAEDQKGSLEKDISNLEKDSLEVRKGNVFRSIDGKVMSSDDDSVIADEIRAYTDAIEAKHLEKQQLDDYITRFNNERLDLEKQAGGTSKVTADHSNTFRSKLDTTKYNYTDKADAETKEAYKKIMEHAKAMLKTNPQEAERIQSEAQKRMIDGGYLVKAS